MDHQVEQMPFNFKKNMIENKNKGKKLYNKEKLA